MKYSLRNSSNHGISRVIIAIIAIVIIIGATIGAYVYMSWLAPTTLEEELRIGIIGPMTGSASIKGVEEIRGATMAAEEINANGGVLGRKIVIYPADEDDSTSMAVSAAEYLCTEKEVVAVIGGIWTGNALASMPIFMQYETIIMYTGPSDNNLMNPVATDYSKYKYAFHPYWTNYGIGVVTADFMKNMDPQPSTIYYVAEDFSWTRQVLEVINETASTWGGEITAEYFPATQTEYTSTVLKIGSIKPDLVINIASGVNGEYFVKQYFEDPITSEIPIYAAPWHYFAIPAVLKSFQEAHPGLVNGLSFGVAGLPDVAVTEKTLPYSQKFLAKYGVQSDPFYDTYTYDCVYMLAEAIERADSLEPDKIVTELEKTDYVGVTGRFVFTAEHRLTFGPDTQAGMNVQLQGDKLVIITPTQHANGTWIASPELP